MTPFEDALDLIASVPEIKRPKYFIVRCFLESSLVSGQRDPDPAFWVMRAEGLDDASSRSFAIRMILDHALYNERDQDVIDHAMTIVRNAVFLLNPVEAAIVFGDICVPVKFNRMFHDAEDIAVIPFSVDTGFSEANVAACLDRLPEPVVTDENAS